MHSVRVGACVLLYELNNSATYIKDYLLGRSDSFTDYLHDTPQLQVRHMCDNQGLVDQLSWLYNQERFHTIPDTADSDAYLAG